MTIHEVVILLNTLQPEKDVLVALFKTDGTEEIFAIEAVRDYNGHAQLDIYEEEEATDESVNSMGMPQVAEGISEEAEEAANAFFDFCERRQITEEEKDLIWNAMAFLCYEQVYSRHGAFYEAIQPLLAREEE
jgi:hypothetical protein